MLNTCWTSRWLKEDGPLLIGSAVIARVCSREISRHLNELGGGRKSQCRRPPITAKNNHSARPPLRPIVLFWREKGFGFYCFLVRNPARASGRSLETAGGMVAGRCGRGRWGRGVRDVVREREGAECLRCGRWGHGVRNVARERNGCGAAEESCEVLKGGGGRRGGRRRRPTEMV